MINAVVFSDDGIVFADYPYAGATVQSAPRVPYAAIEEIVLDAAPPEVRTRREVLFVPATQREELRREGLKIVRCVDVWSLILEPFLDTQFSEAEQERTLQVLESNGVSRAECAAWRSEVGERMLAYNSILWDWVHLGQCDLLEATLLAGQLTAEFYWRTMEIARRGRLRV